MIVIAASLGGVRALSRLLGALPADLPVPVAVIQHQSPRASPSLLTGVLHAHTALRVRLAVNGAALQAGTVLIAPPTRHFTLTRARTVAIVDGPRLHGLHSAADPLFSSAADVFGDTLVAVILTGTGGDGAAGASIVRQHGGRVIVQDPDDAEASGMPEAALATGGADWVRPLDDIAPMLRRLLAIAGA